MTRIHFLFLLLFPISVVSQNLRFFQGSTDMTGKTINVQIEPKKDFGTPFIVYNSSNKPMDVYLKRRLSTSIPADYKLFFAFDKVHYVAWPDLTYAFPDTISIAAGEKLGISPDRDGVIPFLRTGAACFDFAVTCVLSDINQLDSAVVTIQYTCTNSIKEVEAGSFSTPYPIPAHSLTTIDYTFQQPAKKASLVLYNALGESVKEIFLDNSDGKVNIDLSPFHSGLYFYSFVKDGQVVHSGKLLISNR